MYPARSDTEDDDTTDDIIEEDRGDSNKVGKDSQVYHQYKMGDLYGKSANF